MKIGKIAILVLLAGILSFALFFSRTDSQKDKSIEALDLSDRVVIEETEFPSESTSNEFWLDSGGLITVENNQISSIQGTLATSDKWYNEYKKSNPVDTDGGFKPQNLLRIVCPDKKLDYTESGYFRINNYNQSDSTNRNETNGLFFFNRYIDQDNLYYVGIRVDGTAVIKKKISGKYFTMAQSPILDGNYDREKSPTLLPQKSWIGLKSEVKNISSSEVSITLYWDKTGLGDWQKIASVSDKRNLFGGKPFLTAGSTGIRTDFMDVEIKDFQVSEL